jgi:hypothetical protein
MKNVVIWDIRLVAVVKRDVSEERITTIIRVTRIGKLGTTLTGIGNRSTLPRNTFTRAT